MESNSIITVLYLSDIFFPLVLHLQQIICYEIVHILFEKSLMTHVLAQSVYLTLLGNVSQLPLA